MANWKKIFFTTTIGAGIAGLAVYAAKLKRTSAQLESVARASIHSLKLDGLTVRVDVQLKNPSASSLKIKFPFVKLLHNKKVIGTSKLINKDIAIPAHGEAKVEAIMINMPVAGLLSLGSGIYNLLVNKKDVNLTVLIISTVDLGWSTLPYQKAENINLKPKA
jgi:hypothetical protein